MEKSYVPLATLSCLPRLESDCWKYPPCPEVTSQSHPKERDKEKQFVTEGPGEDPKNDLLDCLAVWLVL